MPVSGNFTVGGLIGLAPFAYLRSMISDSIKWNERHGAKTGFHAPDSYLQQQFSRLKPGKALDMACGRGRNAFLLAAGGFETIAADIAEVGLQHLRAAAHERHLSVETMLIDLDEPDLLNQKAPFDTIICINFKPGKALLKLIPDLLSQDGTFLWVSFNELQVALNAFPPAKALHPEEFVDSFTSLKMIEYKRFTDETGHRDAYLFTKTATGDDKACC